MKYSYDEKLRLVLKVVSEYFGVTRVAKEHGMHHEHLRRWVKRYEAYGEDGLRMKPGSYSPEFKLSAVRYMY